MSSLKDRIAQFRKMASDDPENELGHFRLGQLLAEDGDLAEAAKSFEQTLALSPQFSKVYQLLGECLIKLDQKERAIEVLNHGFRVAEERGDRIPKDAMAKLLADIGAPIPIAASATVEDDGPETGFKCERPGCLAGKRAKELTTPPLPDAIGRKIQEKICSDCWFSWFKDYSIKVINELRLDLSSDYGQAEYDKYMREYFGFEEEPSSPQPEA
ncbi:MAG: Fe(2+)-trafficking protein [Bacteroidales bacterium]|nr:Fe(2+)-trafficking protein [Bacteroidales bacterium]